MAQRRCRFKVGKDAQHVRVVDRAFMTVARAFLADVDVIVLNRTEMVVSDEQRRRWLNGSFFASVSNHPLTPRCLAFSSFSLLFS